MAWAREQRREVALAMPLLEVCLLFLEPEVLKLIHKNVLEARGRGCLPHLLQDNKVNRQRLTIMTDEQVLVLLTRFRDMIT